MASFDPVDPNRLPKPLIKRKNDKKVRLLRVRNPWGNEIEWNGDWSDSIDYCQNIPEDLKEELCLIKEDDGEFWISY